MFIIEVSKSELEKGYVFNTKDNSFLVGTMFTPDVKIFHKKFEAIKFYNTYKKYFNLAKSVRIVAVSDLMLDPEFIANNPTIQNITKEGNELYVIQRVDYEGNKTYVHYDSTEGGYYATSFRKGAALWTKEDATKAIEILSADDKKATFQLEPIK